MTADLYDRTKTYSEWALNHWISSVVYQPISDMKSGMGNLSSETDGVGGNGGPLLITGNNDYLGLCRDPRIVEAVHKAAVEHGVNCTGSRVHVGTNPLHEELEQRIAKFMGKEAALVFSSGYLGSQSVISGLADRKDVIYLDREVHASCYDGARLAYCKVRKFRTNDPESLRRLLKLDANKKSGARLVITDGIFSMAGSEACLPELLEVAKEFDARMIVDDAHGFGVMGPMGRGTAHGQGVADQVDVIMATFSKSTVSIGGFVCGEQHLINYLKGHARQFIFTVGLPPPMVAAILKSLDIMESEPERLVRLHENAEQMRKGLKALGYKLIPSTSPINSIVFDNLDVCGNLTLKLREAGVIVTPSLPPASMDGLIRTSVTAGHTSDQIDQILAAFGKCGKAMGII